MVGLSALKSSEWLSYRMRMLPEQLDRARRRYEGLCREAKRIGLSDLLTERDHRFMEDHHD